MQSTIAKLTTDEVARARAELIAELTTRFAITPPSLRDEEKLIRSSESTVRRQGWDGEVVELPGVKVSVDIPFTGEAQLLTLRPSSRRMTTPPYANIDGGKLTLTGSFPGVPSNDDVRHWYQEELTAIRWYLDVVARDVAAYNEDVERSLPTLLDKRAAQLDDLHRFSRDLNLDDATG
jgi:hypothetical protein